MQWCGATYGIHWGETGELPFLYIVADEGITSERGKTPSGSVHPQATTGTHFQKADTTSVVRNDIRKFSINTNGLTNFHDFVSA